MPEDIDLGDPIPSFSTFDQQENEVRDLDFVGQPAVFFFFPKNTQLFSQQFIAEFEKNKNKFMDLNVVIAGISGDNCDSHKLFHKEHSVPFMLLSDENFHISNLFGVWGEMTGAQGKTFGIIPSTFLIDSDGIVQWVERGVNIAGHVDRVLEAIDKFL